LKGVVNIPFRMIFGWVADRNYIAAINLNTFSISIVAIVTFLYPALQYTFYSQAVFAVFFGIGTGLVHSILFLSSYY
jgi:hypothetical protein